MEISILMPREPPERIGEAPGGSSSCAKASESEGDYRPNLVTSDRRFPESEISRLRLGSGEEMPPIHPEFSGTKITTDKANIWSEGDAHPGRSCVGRCRAYFSILVVSSCSGEIQDAEKVSR